MAKTLKRNRFRSFLTLFGLGILIFSMILPLLGMTSLGHHSMSPREFEAHQDVVAQVITSTDRSDLIGTSPTRGNPAAQLVLLKFSDFQCSFCRQASGDMKTFMEGHNDDVLYVYKHFPLTQIHPEAMPAARASWAAQQQGKFWDYHDAIFANQDRLNEAVYENIARDLGLDLEQFNRDRTSAASRTAVEEDLRLAQQLQLTSTPTFVLNDLLVPGGTPIEFFETIVDQVNANS